MTRFAQAFLTLILIGGMAFVAGVRAEVADADREAFRALIQSQLDAFQADDGAAAYSYASPGIQQIFPTADRFMAMVRGAYQPVYRPQSVIFGQIEETANGPVQRVHLIGPDGRNWLALYSLEQQPDGSWLINGCTLTEDPSESI
jgi:hypothetical protein